MSMQRKLLFQVDRLFHEGVLAIRIGMKNQASGALSVATNIEFSDVDPGTIVTDDEALKLTQTEAADLMNELWRAGIRPAGIIESDRERDALKAHIGESSGVINRLFSLLERAR